MRHPARGTPQQGGIYFRLLYVLQQSVTAYGIILSRNIIDSKETQAGIRLYLRWIVHRISRVME